MENPDSSAENASQEPDLGTKPKGSGPKPKKEIPLISTPHDDEIMAQEMADLFDEDRVTHQHGNSEPEKD